MKDTRFLLPQSEVIERSEVKRLSASSLETPSLLTTTRDLFHTTTANITNQPPGKRVAQTLQSTRAAAGSTQLIVRRMAGVHEGVTTVANLIIYNHDADMTTEYAALHVLHTVIKAGCAITTVHRKMAKKT